jgi:cyclic-di-AMP phosphodiesterase PgpH
MKVLQNLVRSLRIPIYRLFKNPTSQRSLAGLVYFLLFTSLLSSGLFAVKFDIQLGDVSTQNISAPYTKDVEDIEQWKKDKEAAAQRVGDVIVADDNVIKGLAKDLGDAFQVLKSTQADINPDEKTKVAKLKGTIPFTAMSEDILTALLKTPLNNITSAETDGTRIILDYAKDTKSAALKADDIPALKDRIKTGLIQLKLPNELTLMLDTFVDLKISSPTLKVDQQQTEAKREEMRKSVPVPKRTYIAKEKILGAGEKVDERVYAALKEYGLIQTFPWKGAAGIALLVLVSMLGVSVYVYNYKREVYYKNSNLVLIGLIMTLVLILGKGIIALNLAPSYNNMLGFLIPLAWGSMVISILVDSQLAIVVTTVMSLFLGIMVDPQFSSQLGIEVALVTGLGGVTGVYSVSHLSQRSDLARAGLFVGATNIVAVLGVGIVANFSPIALAVGAVLGAINGIIASVFTVGSLHWFETGFRITSSVRLLELANPNRPLLRRLLMEAPGTYHHSILVGNLAEAAAESVGADALLVRVGALYHDIGKIKRPYFFIENQFSTENPHDKIAPTLSTLIITSHIKDGIEFAKEHKLPAPIKDIIEQHHADGLVTFFYHKAKEGERPETVNEADFRYEGPKPQTKEAALVCLADSVEAAVRSLKDPAPGQIPGLIRKIIKEKLNDGQLDECDLTFRDLSKIAESFDRVLGGIYHNRIEYPEITDLEGRKNKNAGGNK